MSAAAEALRKAIEYEKQALERYKEAINCSSNEETRQSLKKIVGEKSHTIDSLHWMALAEAGQLETESGSEPKEAEAPASKCPFSGALKDMGVDITKMGEMSKEDMDKMMGGMSREEMSKMMGLNASDAKPDTSAS